MKDPSATTANLTKLLEQGLCDRYALLSGKHKPTRDEAIMDVFYHEELLPYRKALGAIAADAKDLREILQGALGYLYRERYPSDYPDPGHWSNRARALLERMGPAAPRVAT